MLYTLLSDTVTFIKDYEGKRILFIFNSQKRLQKARNIVHDRYKVLLKRTKYYVSICQSYSTIRKEAQEKFKIRDDSRKVKILIDLDFKMYLIRANIKI